MRPCGTWLIRTRSTRMGAAGKQCDKQSERNQGFGFDQWKREMDMLIRCINRSLMAGLAGITLAVGNADAQATAVGLRVTSPDERNSVLVETRDGNLSWTVTAGLRLRVVLAPGGGQAIRIHPAR